MVRLKQRYLLFNILYPENSSQSPKTITPSYLSFHAPTPVYVTAQRFLGRVRKQISYLFGDHGSGVSNSSLKLIYFSPATSTAILRVPRTHYRLVWAALTYMDELPTQDGQRNNVKCVIRVVRVSGTIRKAEEELIRRSRQQVTRARLTGLNSDVLDRFVGASLDGVPADGQVGSDTIFDHDMSESE